ncbi:sigma-24, ECF subfamily [Candidatus Koribacter versatilis Ellin345]|uniref:Sigma-24, ECF subfamily n=1 Tax=Koribacter versatilis (strain Ellin345) TaxID=204669 RepID=Q1IQR2_KORVE|nr:RNA polymerase sigma factor [Candidatus Koribacter versatilis]ABF40788.1 sigma-24, ECF subfamily [Candidatus Koribacter versatilis Ellin345]
MTASQVLDKTRLSEWSDQEIIERVLAGDSPAYELLMRRYNQRLYRLIRSVLRDDAEAEDVMQEAYLRAFRNLSQYEGRSTFSTWIGHIAVNEALARLSKASRLEYKDLNDPAATPDIADVAPTPEAQSASGETQRLLERAIMTLPLRYRSVLMMHDVEDMTTADTAAMLELTEATVRVRLHRARALVRRKLFALVGATSTSAFQIQAPRCDRVVANVLRRIAE